MDRDLLYYESFMLILIISLLGYLLWKYIEKPFQYITNKYGYILIFFVSLLLFTTATYQKSRKIEDFQLNKTIKRYLSYRYDNNPKGKICRTSNQIIKPDEACTYLENNNTDPSIVLWGDSHMDQIALPLSNELNSYGYSVVEFTVAGCPPLANIDVPLKVRKCYNNNLIIMDHIIKDTKYKDIILFAYWNYYIQNNHIELKIDKTFEEILGITIEKLQKNGKRVHIIYPTPKMFVNPPFHKARLEKILPDNNITIRLSQEDYKKQSLKIIQILDNNYNKYHFNKINLSKYLFSNDFYVANNQDVVFYRDDNHLSTRGGGRLVAKGIAKQILKGIQREPKSKNYKIYN
ncbi:MAG: hypothetical protein DSY58_09165 [Desulfobulbus sp.]|nr:MAG: hypothetical protein DSY58_09165 [Desulfobulbus sp.]